MSSFTALVNQQEDLIKVVAQILPKFKKLAHAKRTAITIQRRINELQSVIPSLRNNHVALKTSATTDQLAQPYFTENWYDTCLVTADDTLDFLEDLLAGDVSKASLESTQTQGRARSKSPMPFVSMPLPKLQLPTFGGEIKEWEEFRDRFTAMIIKDIRLSDADRMKYLCTALIGWARRAIAHLRITDTNFSIAWDTVCQKFQNVRENLAARFDAFHAIQNISAHSLKGVQSLQEIITSTSRSIQSLGRRVDGWNDLYADCILRKMDKDTRIMLADRLNSDKDPISLEQIDEFLEHRIRVLQSVGRSPVSSSLSGRSENVTRKQSSRVSLKTNVTGTKCVLCSALHKLNSCDKFRKMSIPDRRTVVQEKHCCWLCLSSDHTVRGCKSSYRCNNCQNKHHILLHQDSKYFRSDAAKSSVAGSSTDTKATSSSSKIVSHTYLLGASSELSVLLATAWVKIYGDDGRSTTVRALLDQGSEVTLLSENIAGLLRLPRVKRLTRISGIGGIACTSKHVAHIGISNKSSSCASHFTDIVIVPWLTQFKPARYSDTASWSHLDGLALADPHITRSDPIDIVIGAELYGCFLRRGIRRGNPDSPIAQNTALGWIVSGRYASSSKSSEVRVHATVLEQLNDTLQNFWQLEELPNESFLSTEEKEYEDHFRRTVSRTSTGRYIVELPFRTGFQRKLGQSRFAAVKCFKSIERRYATDAPHWSAYVDFMREYQALGHMVPVDSLPNDQPRQDSYYIPHHAVFRTVNDVCKIRVVFNASRKTTDGTSLNDHLLIGPRLQQDLPIIVLNWRVFEFVVTTDITKMFRQVKVAECDSPFQRIVWRESPSAPIQDYELVTITYGTSSAPYQSLRSIKQLEIDEGDDFPLARSDIQKSAYVDDFFFGASTIDETIQIRNELIGLLARGQFELSKWSANHRKLLAGLSSTEPPAVKKDLTPSESIKILGIKWNPGSDEFHYSVTTPIPHQYSQ